MASGWHRKTKNTPAEIARRKRYNSPEHRTARAHYSTLVTAGHGYCWRCNRQLYPGAWHVGHDDSGTRILGPECIPCNTKTAASRGARTVNARRQPARGTSRLRW
jgi:hypothetical protein